MIDDDAFHLVYLDILLEPTLVGCFFLCSICWWRYVVLLLNTYMHDRNRFGTVRNHKYTHNTWSVRIQWLCMFVVCELFLHKFRIRSAKTHQAMATNFVKIARIGVKTLSDKTSKNLSVFDDEFFYRNAQYKLPIDIDIGKVIKGIYLYSCKIIFVWNSAIGNFFQFSHFRSHQLIIL